MKTFNYLLAISGVVLTLNFGGAKVLAQGGGGGGGMAGMDPTAMLQRQADAMRVALAVTNDDEWSVISPRLVKVMQLQTEVRMAGIANMARGAMAQRGGGGGGMRGFAAFLGEPDPASAALTKVLDDNAPLADVKAAMAKLREARKRKQAEMVKAQADMQGVISIRQEAILLNDGMLD